VTDPYADAGSIVRGSDVVGDNDGLLEVGETWGYTAAHTVTQAEIDSNGDGNGLLENIATADSNESGPDTDDASVPVAYNPSLNITKDATVPGDSADVAGELISRGVEDPCPPRSPHGEEEIVDAPEPVEGLADDSAPFPGTDEIGGGAEAFLSCQRLGQPLERPTNTIGRSAHEQHARPGLEEVTGKDEPESTGAPGDDHTAAVPGCAAAGFWVRGVHGAECSGCRGFSASCVSDGKEIGGRGRLPEKGVRGTGCARSGER
jgi:hypothetical protein